MKILHRAAMLLMTFALCLGTAVAFAAPNYENPFEDAYKDAAAELHEQGTAKIVYHLLDTNRAPLAGAVLVYNLPGHLGEELVADAGGRIEFDVKVLKDGGGFVLTALDANGRKEFDFKKPPLVYVRSVKAGNRNVPIGGSTLAVDITRNDIHRGTVKYFVLHRYSSATFMAYDAGGDGRFY